MTLIHYNMEAYLPKIIEIQIIDKMDIYLEA